eukprot:UN33278
MCGLDSCYGGAMTTTVDPNKYVHVVCAQFLGQEFTKPKLLEKVSGVREISGSKLLHSCTICKSTEFYKVTCEDKFCSISAHPTCARKAQFFMEDIDETSESSEGAMSTDGESESDPNERFVLNQSKSKSKSTTSKKKRKT